MWATAAVPSVEPSSITMTSSGACVCPSTDTTHSASIPARLKVGMTTLTRAAQSGGVGVAAVEADTAGVLATESDGC
jgi:hypothetical protein